MASATGTGRPVLHLALAGPFALAGPEPVAITARKNRALLAILALSPGLKATRERLCGLLWGERPEEQARSSLRQSLAVLRKELGPHADVLVTRDDIIGLSADRIRVDVLRISALAAQSGAEGLAEAADLLSGELLADTVLKEEGFQEWLEAERRSLAASAIGVFERLAGLPANPRRIEHARRLVALDPLRESSHRALMQAFADAGDRAQALRQFDICRDLLRKELDVEPSLQTSDLRRRIAVPPRDLALAAPSVFAPGQPGSVSPVIAVLPFQFDSMGTDGGYFAEGIVEDVTSELSRYGGIAVIGSSSSARYRGSGDTAAAFGSRLGASHVVTGSLRIVAGETWRIAVQLTETETGRNIWSERYEFRRSELESALDATASAIAAIVESRIAAAGADKAVRKPIGNWSAFDNYLRGRALCLRYAETEAVPYLDSAVDLDPELAPAFAWRSLAYVGKFYENYDTSWLVVAEASAKRAIALDSADPRGHHALGLTRLWQRRHALAGEHYDRGLALNPADLLLGYDKANWLTYTGYPQAAFDLIAKLRRRDPFPPAYVHELTGRTLFQLGRYAECIDSFDNLATDHYWQHGWLAVAKAKLGRLPEARQHAERMLQLKPGANLSWFKRVFGFQSLDLCKDAIEGLKLAGIGDDDEESPDLDTHKSRSEPASAAIGDARRDPVRPPLIIVRPFEDVAADGGNAVLARGVAMDLVQALCRFSEIEVSQPGHDVRQGQKCFTLTGSVRWLDRVRVTVDLMDETGRVVWAQRYDRAPSDIFVIQDEIVEACVYNLVNVVNRKTLDEVKAGRGNSFSAYQLFLRGRSHAYRLNRDDLFKARELLGDAVKADPEFAPAHAWLSEVHWLLWWGGIVDDDDAPELALACARLAVNLDSDDQHGLAELGQALYTLGRFEEASIALGRAMASNPNNPDVLTIVAYFKLCCGDASGALDMVRKAMRLDPAGHYGLVHGIVLFSLEEWDLSIVHLRMVRAQLPAVKAWMAVSLAMAGQDADAKNAAAGLRREWASLHGNAPVASLLLKRFPFRREADRLRLAMGLFQAGLSDQVLTP